MSTCFFGNTNRINSSFSKLSFAFFVFDGMWIFVSYAQKYTFKFRWTCTFSLDGWWGIIWDLRVHLIQDFGHNYRHMNVSFFLRRTWTCLNNWGLASKVKLYLKTEHCRYSFLQAAINNHKKWLSNKIKISGWKSIMGSAIYAIKETGKSSQQIKFWINRKCNVWFI